MLTALVAGCAAQQLSLQQPNDVMLAAVEATTPQTRIPISTVDVVGSAAPGTAASEPPAEGVNITYGRNGFALPCSTTTASVVQSLGFVPEQINSVRYDIRTTQIPPDQISLQGLNAWVNFIDRSGYLVISFLPNCQYITFYTRYGLELPTQAA